MTNIVKVIFLTLALFTAGCGNSDSNPPPTTPIAPAPTPANPPRKPLPTECKENLDVMFTWKKDLTSYGYSISIGHVLNNYMTFISLGLQADGYVLNLERDTNYAVHLEKNPISNFQDYYPNSTIPKNITFTIPSCANRAAWFADHADYSEPMQFNIDWSKAD